MRRVLRLAALLLGVGLAYYFLSQAERSAPAQADEPGALQRPATPPAGANVPPERSVTELRDSPQENRRPDASPSDAPGPGDIAPYVEADFPIVAALNAPDSTIARDLEVVSQVFAGWQSNFPREGNPVGENADITAALLGKNRLGFAFVPQGHRAVNERGELCDRWGTPFRFHQLSGTEMEIRSAGPDRKFATEDDAVWTPE